MDEVLKLASEISDDLKGSKTYTEYKKAYEAIKDNAEIMEKISNMKKAHIEFATNYKNGNYDFNREKFIAQEFYKLMLDKNVETYFMNELRLVNALSKILDTVTDDCVLKVFD